ncbi:MAG TPA: sugar phosphate isomerase/epimerase [Puia sp.]|nr:sugar phosphate isomerase/epimerase [Puia sp.]
MPNRRTFLRQTGLTSAGLLLRPKDLFATQPLIGLQLYTVRTQIAKDPDGTLAKVAEIGYNSVEAMGYGNGKFFGLTPAQFSAMIKKHGLKSPSGHYGMGNFLSKGDMADLKDNIAAAATMGHKYIVIPWIDDNLRTSLEDYKKLAPKFNAAAVEARKNGLKLAYHNHDFEFKDWGGGKTGFDILLKETDPTLVNFEMDIYWATRAGQDPVKLINENPGRFKMWHLKDMSQKEPPSYSVGGKQYFTHVGAGIIDFRKIFQYKRKSGMQYFFVEQDETNEPVFDAIAQSYKYVKTNLV